MKACVKSLLIFLTGRVEEIILVMIFNNTKVDNLVPNIYENVIFVHSINNYILWNAFITSWEEVEKVGFKENPSQTCFWIFEKITMETY